MQNTAYSIVISDEAKTQLQAILNDDSQHEPGARLRYVEAIETLCYGLAEMPNRFQEIEINNIQYRVFSHKGHRIFYRILEPGISVVIVSILHDRQDYKRWL